MCLRVGVGIVWGSQVFQWSLYFLSSSVFSCELKIHLRLWCIHCVRTILSPGCAIPSLIFHYQCACSCVYMMLVALPMCLRVWAGIMWGSQVFQWSLYFLSSSVGMSIEWLTGVSQVLGSRPDVFSCEYKKKKIIHVANQSSFLAVFWWKNGEK